MSCFPQQHQDLTNKYGFSLYFVPQIVLSAIDTLGKWEITALLLDNLTRIGQESKQWMYAQQQDMKRRQHGPVWENGLWTIITAEILMLWASRAALVGNCYSSPFNATNKPLGTCGLLYRTALMTSTTVKTSVILSLRIWNAFKTWSPLESSSPATTRTNARPGNC